MVAPNFYNQADQNIYNKGFSFIPQEMYRGGAFNMPTTPDDNTGGITTLPTAMNIGGGGGGGGYYAGPASNLVTGFQTTVDNRQKRLNNPSNTFLGFNTMTNPPTEASTILAQNIGSLPQEMTMMGKVQNFLTPQSADDILTSGYNKPYGSSMGPGIIGSLLGKMDNYHNLSRPDQAFIAANMGYTGPTVFGDNTSGLSKDPFGLNTRSAFGNYAERVGVESEKLGGLLSGDLADKYGAEWDEEKGMFVGTNAARANQMTKMLRAKYSFYTNKNMEYADLVKKNAELQGIQDTKAAQNFAAKNPNYGNPELNINPGSGGGSGYDPQADYSGSDKRSQDNRSSDLGFSDIRLKENVELIGKSPSNINIYSFNYLNNPTKYQGVMAHEVPWASQKHDSGYLMVDYNKVDVDFKKDIDYNNKTLYKENLS